MSQVKLKPFLNITFQEGYTSKEHMIIQKLDVLIETHFKEHQKQSFYIQQLKITEKRLKRLIQAYRSATFKKLIQARLHSEAVSLLVGTCMSMKTIAYELGYCDPGHFNRAFKKIESYTPKKFREIYTTINVNKN